ncbi:MAG: rRNA maturation RNase YbeY [Oligosphaeraceae bacterium]
MILRLSKMPSLRGVRNLARFQKALEAVLPLTGLPLDTPGEIHVVLVTIPRITLLNAMHLHHQGDTDVITYDLRDGASSFPLPPEAGEPVLAELYLCPDVARRQAPAFAQPPSRELFRYAVHGLLHLAGEDDLTPQALHSMRLEEERLLSAAEAQGFSLEHFLS